MTDNVTITLIIAITIIIVLLILGKRFKSMGVRHKEGEFEADLTAYKSSGESSSKKRDLRDPVNKMRDGTQAVQLGIANRVKAYFRKGLQIFQLGIGNDVEESPSQSRNKKK